MVWTPDLPVRPDASQRQLQEWLNRQLRKAKVEINTAIKSAGGGGGQPGALGYGGLNRTSSQVVSITITNTYQKITHFQSAILSSPLGVTQDLANDRIILDAGSWDVKIAVSIRYGADTGTSDRSIELQCRNSAGSIIYSSINFDVPRYSERGYGAVAFQTELSAQNEVEIWMRSHGPGITISLQNYYFLELSATRFQ